MKKFFIDSKKIVALVVIVFLFSACENWLDIAPEKDLIKDNFWKKTEDANNALAATYSAFRNTGDKSFIWGELRADIITGFSVDYATIALGEVTPKNPVIHWSLYYKTINLANTLMYYDNEVLANDKSFTQKMKDGIDAEALFLRSFSYFYLVRIWKNVPLIVNPSISDTCDIYTAASNESVIIKQIISDLLIAKDKAYTTEFQGNLKYFKGRANKYSIMALLADVYLWDQQYQKCIDYCDSIINSGLYSLQPLDTWFDIYNPGNSVESIFELQCEDDATDDQINPMFKSAAPNYIQLISLGNGSDADVGFAPNTYYLTLFPDNTDIRDCNGGTAIWKYIGINLKDILLRSSGGERNLNILYYRYADVLLMKAEALNELGKVTEALDYVNKTFERATTLVIAGVTDQDEMRSLILFERAKEFACEGKRWFDLLRTAKRNNFKNKKVVIDVLLNNADEKSRAVMGSKVYDTMMYYLPVPYDELKLNKNLKQNPFYER